MITRNYDEGQRLSALSDISLLRRSSLFSGMVDSKIREIVEKGKSQRYIRPCTIYHAGDPLTSVYLILQGTGQLYRQTPDGQEITYALLMAGELFGVRDFYQRHMLYTTSARVQKDTVVIEFNRQLFLDLLNHVPGFMANCLLVEARTNDTLRLEAEHKILLSCAEQIVCYLLRLIDTYQLNPSNFILPFNKTLIASCLGMELETFSRALIKIRRLGIKIEGNRISFLNYLQNDDTMCERCSLASTCVHNRIVQEMVKG